MINNNIGTKEKVFIGILAIVGMGILVLGIWQFQKNLEVPFFIPEDKENKTASIDNLEDLNDLYNENSVNVAELKNKDTDEDGLSDYEELYIYNTSPYIEDTDSDGYLDKEEIENGYDPNCPKGKNCMSSTKTAEPERGVDIVPSTNSAFSSEGYDMNSFFESLSGGSQSENSSSENLDEFGQTIMAGDLTADNLREILRQQGVPEEDIAKINDDALLQVYQETIEDMEKEDLGDE